MCFAARSGLSRGGRSGSVGRGKGETGTRPGGGSAWNGRDGACSMGSVGCTQAGEAVGTIRYIYAEQAGMQATAFEYFLGGRFIC